MREVVTMMKIKASPAYQKAVDGEGCRAMDGRLASQVLDRPPFRQGCTCVLVMQKVRREADHA